MTTTFSPLSGSPNRLKSEINTSTSPPTLFEQQQQQQQAAAAPAKPASKSKPRKRVNTAEKRHQHNAIERQRRETLNSKFLSLARLLPALATHRRPSKSAIVNGSISHLTRQREQRLLAAKLLRRICADHDALLGEVNEWRKANGYAAKESGSAWSNEVDEVCSVEKEIFGNFQNFDDGDGDDDDGEMMDKIPEIPSTSNFGSINGLITPRSSTELDAMAHAQAIFGNNTSVSDSRPAPAVTGLSWSNDFAFSMNNAQPPLGFVPFMTAESTVDQSSSSSPTNSQQGAVVTPPTTAGNSMIFDHTPSPRSSHSFEEIKPNVQAPNQMPGWNVSQMLYLQQQAQLHRQQQHSGADWNGIGPGMFPVTQPQQSHLGGHGHGQASGDDITQQLLASIFPNNNATPDQVQQWRKAALSHLMPQNAQPAQTQQQPPVDLGVPRNNMGLTLGVDGLWPQNQNHAVEGF